MLTIAGRLKALKFTVKEYRVALESAIEQVVTGAIGEWLRAVVTSVSGSFPVQTGMAAGSLMPLHRWLAQQGILVNFVISPKKKQKGKSVSAGEALGKKKPFIIPYRNQYGVFRYEFKWHSDVVHYRVNEYYRAPNHLNLKNPTPWESTKAGNEAFEIYINNNLQNFLPDITDFIVETER